MNANEKKIGLPDRIRLLRGQEVQANFAHKIGVHPVTLSKYETGKSIPDSAILARIAEATSANPAWLLFGQGEPFPRQGKKTTKTDGDLPTEPTDLDASEDSEVSVKTGIGDRFRQLRGDASQEAFAKRVGLSLPSWKRYEYEDRHPNAEVLQRLCTELKVNPSWLLLGIGPMFLDDAAPLLASDIAIYDRDVGQKIPDKGMVLIPSVQLRPRAGERNGEDNEEEYVDGMVSFRASWVRNEMNLDPSALSVVQVKGDSMEPTLRSGDMVMVDHRQSDPRTGGIFVVMLDGALLVKRVERRSNDIIRIISENPSYEIEELTKDDQEKLGFRIIGKVVWIGKRT